MRLIGTLLLATAALMLGACNRHPAAKPAPLSAEANAAYLAENAKKSGVVSVPGIQYEVLKPGNGPQPTRRDCVSVYYKGMLIDGRVFDQTEAGQPATFPTGRLIPGWTQALQMMHAGEKWRLVIPAALAYGHEGAGGVIPPDQTLVFELELLKVIPVGQPGCGG
jgi:FKBP-type peptidyl-prolyl cis-trans isomerase